MPRDDLRSYPGYVGLVEVLLPSGRDLVEPPASHFPTLADPRSPRVRSFRLESAKASRNSFLPV